MFSVQELLTKHKMLAANFLEANYDKVFIPYQSLLVSDNYVTRRQALKVPVVCMKILNCEYCHKIVQTCYHYWPGLPLTLEI